MGGGLYFTWVSFFFFPAGSATSWVCQNLFRRSFIVFISLFVLPNRRSWIMKLMNQKGLLCLKWHQSCTETARYHFFLLSGFLCAGFPRTDFSLNDASFAANMDDLTQVKVEYETLPGWCCSTETARSFEELPVQAQNYIRFIEDFLQVPGL